MIRTRYPMTGWKSVVLACGLAIAMSGAWSTAIAAAGVAGATPQSVQPVVECALTPLTLPLFGATPPADIVLGTASPIASPAAIDLRPATRDEVVGIQAVMEMIRNCLNTGNPLEVYAVFSTRYLATEYSDPTQANLPAFEQELAGPTVPVDPPFTFDPVDVIGVQADGRVQVVLTVHQNEKSWTNTLLLVHERGAWLIDEVVA